MVAIMYWNYYASFTVSSYVGLYQLGAALIGLLHIAENACLVTLSFISSTENYSMSDMYNNNLLNCNDIIIYVPF